MTPPRWWLAAAALLAGLGGVLAPATAKASASGYCEEPGALDAAQYDRMLRFAGVIRAALEASGERVALVSRAGLDLARFGQRYSHAGLSLRASAETPWAVRQLYFDCAERRPRLFDQGLAAFVRGMDRPSLGFVSVVLMPPDRAAALEATALDKHTALALLAADYSANAHAFSTRYQNCNQWVAELMAQAWNRSDGTATEAVAVAGRTTAQAWLRHAGYSPTVMRVGSPLLLWLSALSPWLHSDDHPPQDIEQLQFRVSMPSSLENFVQQHAPGAQRLEFCHTDTQIVVRRGWRPLDDACRAEPEDTVTPLD